MAMSAPLYINGVISGHTNMLFSIFGGFLFGFFLEVTGFASAKNITDEFYFRNNRVIQMMVSAIITSALWFLVFGSLGLIQIPNIWTPNLYLWPYIFGGLLFGVGMAMSGYCPGTSVAAIASGKKDAMVFGLGMLVGMAIFIFGFPFEKDFYVSSDLGQVYWHTLFNVNTVVSFIITILIGGFFMGFMQYMVSYVNKNRTESKEYSMQYVIGVLALIFVILATVLLKTLLPAS
jgi:uncharacterized membrane protein YedE/YeeE